MSNPLPLVTVESEKAEIDSEVVLLPTSVGLFIDILGEPTRIEVPEMKTNIVYVWDEHGIFVFEGYRSQAVHEVVFALNQEDDPVSYEPYEMFRGTLDVGGHILTGKTTSRELKHAGFEPDDLDELMFFEKKLGSQELIVEWDSELKRVLWLALSADDPDPNFSIEFSTEEEEPE